MLALTRKWRPKNFETLVGQAPTVKILTRALMTQRLHHAYLFTGTRGVGKTTIARILAKCLNCERGISPTPCEQCNICLSIQAGHFIDLIEIDAASKTKVEDTRALLDQVPYGPAQGRFKSYLIDEVHMLSGHSFNALLKTLEEPPAHVKFLLATTDPRKLPVTILSRCLQFHLRHIPLPDLTKQLAYIAEQEGAKFEKTALHEIAVAAQGSFRDAENLLEQTILYAGEEGITLESVRAFLGLIPKQAVIELLKNLASKDPVALLNTIQTLHDLSPDYMLLLNECVSVIHQLTIAQLAPRTLDASLPEYGDLQQLSKQFLPEELQLYYQIGVSGQKDLAYTPEPRMGFEMTLLRMLAFRPGKVSPVMMEVDLEEGEEKGGEGSNNKTSQPRIQTNSVSPASAPRVSCEPKEPMSHAERWKQALSVLNLSGLLKQIAANGVVHEWTDNHIGLWLDQSQRPLFSKRLELELQKHMAQYLQKSITLKITFRHLDQLPEKTVTVAQEAQAERQEKQAAAMKAIQADPNIQTWVKDFKANIEQVELVED